MTLFFHSLLLPFNFQPLKKKTGLLYREEEVADVATWTCFTNVGGHAAPSRRGSGDLRQPPDALLPQRPGRPPAGPSSSLTLPFAENVATRQLLAQCTRCTFSYQDRKLWLTLVK